MPLRNHVHSHSHTHNRQSPIVVPAPAPMMNTHMAGGFPPTFVQESMTQYSTVTGAAIVETHVNQNVVHEHHHQKNVVHERHIDQPILHERHIDQNVVHERHIDQPIIHERHMDQPVIHERHIDQPIVHERHIDKPVIHERHIDQPIIHEKHYEQPIIHEKHIEKTVVHEVHVNQPIIHENVVLPARVEIATHTNEMMMDSQYTSAPPIVMSDRTMAPTRTTVEYSTNAPIMHGGSYTGSHHGTVTSMNAPYPMAAMTATVVNPDMNPILVHESNNNMGAFSAPMVAPQSAIVVTEKHHHHRPHLHRHGH